MTVERRDGATPNGGAYALVAYMRTDPLREVAKDDATTVIISEYDADGNWITETVGSLAAAPWAPPIDPVVDTPRWPKSK